MFYKDYLWLLRYTRPFLLPIICTWLLSIAVILLKAVSIWVSVECIQKVLLQSDEGRFGNVSSFVVRLLDNWTKHFFSGKDDYSVLVSGAIFLAFTVVGLALVRYLKLVIFIHINERILAKIRYQLFQHMSGFDLLFTRNRKIGNIESLLFHDVDNLAYGILDTLDRIFLQPLSVLFYTWILFSLSPVLTVVLYGLIFVSFGVTYVFGGYLEKKSRIQMEKTAELHGNAVEYLSVAVLAKIFNREEFEQRRWLANCRRLASAKIRFGVMRDLIPLTSNSFKALALLVVIITGGRYVYMEQTLSADELAKIVLLIPVLLYPVEALATLYGSLRSSLASIKRIREVFSMQGKQPATSGEEPVNDPVFPLCLEGISKYYGRKKLFSGVNFSLGENELIALYGPSGSGKSNLISILAGLSFPDRGTLTAGRTLLTEKNQSIWRQRLGIVLQESCFFNTTIRENLRYGCEDATDDEMMEVLFTVFPNDQAFHHRTVLDRVIGNFGGNLSGGERQRLSIARALLRQPVLLLLDEPTSDLDGENRASIYETITRLTGKITMLISTHDEQFRRYADRVYLLEDGTLIEQIEKEEHAE